MCMRTVRVLPGYMRTVGASPGVYEDSKSIARGYVRTVRVSPGVYGNSKSIIGGI